MSCKKVFTLQNSKQTILKKGNEEKDRWHLQWNASGISVWNIRSHKPAAGGLPRSPYQSRWTCGWWGPLQGYGKNQLYRTPEWGLDDHWTGVGGSPRSHTPEDMRIIVRWEIAPIFVTCFDFDTKVHCKRPLINQLIYTNTELMIQCIAIQTYLIYLNLL